MPKGCRDFVLGSLFFYIMQFNSIEILSFIPKFPKLTKFSFFIKIFSKSIKVFFTFIAYFPD
jgi:hypothetical protein